MRIEPTTDVDFIVSCVTRPETWEALTDDGAPELYFPPIGGGFLWVRVGDYGVFLLTKHNHVTSEVHTVLLPSARGKAVEIGKAALAWAFEQTEIKRIITNVPSFNPHAQRMAIRVGFVKIGVNAKSFQKRGILYDQTILGVSKEDICQQ